jgi:hypothetical protein
MIPSLLRSRPFGSVNRTRWRPWMRTPCRCTLRNSLRRRIRSSRERLRSTSARHRDSTGPPGIGSSTGNASGRTLSLPQPEPFQRSAPFYAAHISLGNRKALPPLGPAPPQDFPSGLRAHALAEPMGPLAPPVVRLIRAFHALITLAARLGGHTRRETIMVATVRAACQRKPEPWVHDIIVR